MMLRPRFLAKTLASLGGCFWLPCPICGENFAGFECGSESLMRTMSVGAGVCSRSECLAEAHRRNKALYSERGFQVARSRDRIVESVRDDLLRRSQIGIAKYGVTLERTDLNLRDWLQHAYEETLDQANYLKRAIVELDGRGTS